MDVSRSAKAWHTTSNVQELSTQHHTNSISIITIVIKFKVLCSLCSLSSPSLTCRFYLVWLDKTDCCQRFMSRKQLIQGYPIQIALQDGKKHGRAIALKFLATKTDGEQLKGAVADIKVTLVTAKTTVVDTNLGCAATAWTTVRGISI